MEIRADDLAGREVAVFLEEHVEEMLSLTAVGSAHALDLEVLKQPDVTFWVARDDGDLVGCGALKELDETHGEIKSMRVAKAHRGRGVGAMVLQHLLDEAKRRGYRRVSLETGSMPFMAPARALYAKFGFEACEPFAQYKEDPNSVFMTRVL